LSFLLWLVDLAVSPLQRGAARFRSFFVSMVNPQLAGRVSAEWWITTANGESRGRGNGLHRERILHDGDDSQPTAQARAGEGIEVEQAAAQVPPCARVWHRLLGSWGGQLPRLEG